MSEADTLVHRSAEPAGSVGAKAARSSDRFRRIALTAAASAVARACSFCVPLVTAGLFLPYMGEDLYGLWMAVAGLVSLFAFADLGLGSGLLTGLSRAWGRNDLHESRVLISSAFFCLVAVAAGAGVVLWGVFDFVPWSTLFNASTPSASQACRSVVALVLGAQIVQLPFSLIQRIQLALQRGYESECWQIVGSAVAVAAMVCAYFASWGAVAIIAIAAVCPAVTTAANFAWFFARRPELRPRWRYAGGRETGWLVRTGGAFFALSILTTLGLAVDNVIVAQACSLEDVSVFAVVSRLASVISVTLPMLCRPLWSANAEALACGDYDWVRRALLRALVATTFFALLASAIFVTAGPSVLDAWIGPRLEAPRSLLLGCAAREIVLCVSAPFFMVLNAAGRIGIQIKLFVVFTPLVIALKYSGASIWGVSAVPWGMAVLYAAFVLPVSIWSVLSLLRHPAE